MMFNLQGSTLFQIGFIIIIATIFAYISKLFKQPLIPAYILTGIVLGPLVLGIIKDTEIIRFLSEIGIAFLLFIVGLEINLKKLKDIGVVSSVGGLIQIVLVFLIGFFISLRLGFSEITSLYIALVLTFSSTMIVVKLIADKRQIDTLHGRITIGILLVQDIVVILVLAALSNIGNFSPLVLSYSLMNGVVLLLIAILLSKYIFPYLFNFAAKSEELLFLLSLTTCFFFILLAYIMNFSITVGAFIAGVGLATLPYNVDIIGRIKPLKDFFSVIFFVFLGIQLIFRETMTLIEPMIFFLLIIILFKPFILFLSAILFGYKKRISFLTGMYLGQVSEFSLILGMQGLLLGHITKDIFSLIILLTIITMVLTAYLVNYDSFIYNKLANFLEIFEKISIGTQKLSYDIKKSKKIILFGCHRMGSIFLNHLRKISKSIIVVDHNPETIKLLIKEKIPCLYGDVSNQEVLDSLNFKDAELIISTVPDDESNEFLIEYAKSINPKIRIVVTTDHINGAFDMYDYGADYVILPHLASGEHFSALLQNIVRKKQDISRLKNEHIKHLEKLKIYK